MSNSKAVSRPVILLAFANEHDGHRYLRNLPEELRLLRETLGPGERDDRFRLELVPNATFDEIKSALRDNRDRVVIFHYGGHAGPDRLLLESASGLGRTVHAPGLAKLLGQQSGLKTVFLNGCSTRAHAVGLLQANVPAVIATSVQIDDHMARLFALDFYAELASGANLRAAFEAAKAQVTAAHGADPDLFRSGQRRDLGALSGEDVSDIEGFPWDLYHRTEADQVLRWNLFLDDPVHGLPDLPGDILPPAEPFRRLLRFEREHALVFFGRGRQIREMYDLLVTPKTYPIVLYHGPTGVGKSSILEAGLLPRLERDFQVVALRRDPDLGLLGTLRAGLSIEGQSDGDLAAAWKRREDEAGGRPLVVILDQGEEAFTRPHLARPKGVSEALALSQSWIDPEREVRELVLALKVVFGPSAERPRGKLILGFRMEWLQPFQEAFRTATLGFEPMALGPLERAGIVEAIEGPAKAPWLRGRYGLEIASVAGQTPLAEVVAADLQADAGSAVAPTLQVLLGAMWDEAKRLRPSQPCFDRPLYERLRKGGILLADFLDHQLKALGQTHTEDALSGFALDLLEYHTTPLGTAEGHSRDEVTKRYPHRIRDIGSVLDRLKELYLLIETPDFPGATRLAHDTLAPLVRMRFAQALGTALRGRRILEKRVVDWQDGREGPVMDRADLEIVEQALTGMRSLTSDEQRLLGASRAHEQERQVRGAQEEQARLDAERKAKEATEQRLKDQEAFNKKLIRVLAGLAAAVVIAIGGFIVAEIERQSARFHEGIAKDETLKAQKQEKNATEAGLRAEKQSWISEAQRLAAQSVVERQGMPAHPQRSFLLAVESIRATVAHGQPIVPAAEQALHDCFGPAQGRFLVDHESWITALAFAPDGRLVTGGADGTARVWDLTQTKPTPLVLAGHKDMITALAFAPDGRLVTGSHDETARVWELKDPKAKTVVLTGHQRGIGGLAFAPDGRLVTTDGEGTARVWDLTKPQAALFELQGHRGWISGMGFAADGHLVTAGLNDGTVRIWDLKAPTAELHVLTGHKGAIWGLALAPDGRRVVTAGGDGTARVWDLKLPEAKPVVVSGQEEGINGVDFAPDGRLVTTGLREGTAWVVDLTDPKAKPIVLAGHKGVILARAFAPDGRLVTAGSDGTARVWDLKKPRAQPIVLTGHDGAIFGLRFAPDGLLVSASDDGTARIWDLKDLKGIPVVLTGHTFGINALGFAPDGRLVSASDDGTARVWDLKNPKVDPLVLSGHVGQVLSMTFAPDGRLVTAGQDGTARAWDLTNPKPKPVILTGNQPSPVDPTNLTHSIYTLGFAADGRLVTPGEDGSARVWDLKDPKSKPVVLTGNKSVIYCLGFGPDGRLATADIDGTARVWDLNHPEAKPMVFTGHKGTIHAVSFDPDGRLITAGEDETARVWDLKNAAAKTLVLTGHTDEITTLALAAGGRLITAGRDGTARAWNLKDPTAKPVVFSANKFRIEALGFAPDGRLVTAGEDGTARLWDLNDPKANPVAFTGHDARINALVFAPDGCLVTADSVGKLCVWELDTRRLIDLASTAVGRNLTIAEWDQFFDTGIDEYHPTFQNLPDGKGVAEMRKAMQTEPPTNTASPAPNPAASGALTN